jgi:hypothetical protein
MKINFKTTLLGLLLVASVVTSAQGLSPQGLTAAGGTMKTITAMLEFSVGDLAVQTVTNGTAQLTQGVLQPALTWVAPPPLPPPPAEPITFRPPSLNNGGTTLTVGNVMLEWDLGDVAVSTLSNGTNMLTQGLLQPKLATLATAALTTTTFTAKTLDAAYVTLDWKTEGEDRVAGFYIERRREGEKDFSTMRFVKTKAPGGTATASIDYKETDANAGNGTTWYRIRQVHADSSISFVDVQTIQRQATTVPTLKAWPVPAPNDFYVTAIGIGSDVLQLYDANGRLVSQMAIENSVPVKLHAHSAGLYVLKLKRHPEVTGKVTVQ